MLGNREPPTKKVKKKEKKQNEKDAAFDYWKDDSDSDIVNKYPTGISDVVLKKTKYKKSAYLSDEEEEVSEWND